MNSVIFKNPSVNDGLKAFLALVFATLLSISTLPHSSFAQQAEPYKTLPLKEQFDVPNPLDVPVDEERQVADVKREAGAKKRVLSDMSRRVRDALEGSGNVNQQDFDALFKEYYFANMTQTSARKLGRVWQASQRLVQVLFCSRPRSASSTVVANDFRFDETNRK